MFSELPIATINIAFFALMILLYMFVGDHIRKWMVSVTKMSPEIVRNILNTIWMVLVFSVILFFSMNA